MNGYLIAAIATLLAGGSFYLGGLRGDSQLANYKTSVEAQHVTQLQAVVATMNQHDNAAASQHAADQKVIDAYDTEKALPPATAGVVQRMRLVEAATCSAGDRQLPSSGAVAGRAQAAGGIPRSDAEGDRLLQAALDAADRDADRLNTAVKLAP